MTNKNTRSKGEYALDHILWGLISWLWFTKSLFRNIEGLSYDRSRLVLLGALTASILLGLAVTWKRRRNNLSLFVNLVLPYEIYTLIVYRETAPVLIRILIITSVCLSVIYAVLVLRPHIRAGARKAVVLWRRLTHSALGIRTIAALFPREAERAANSRKYRGLLFWPAACAECHFRQPGAQHSGLL